MTVSVSYVGFFRAQGKSTSGSINTEPFKTGDPGYVNWWGGRSTTGSKYTDYYYAAFKVSSTYPLLSIKFSAAFARGFIGFNSQDSSTDFNPTTGKGLHSERSIFICYNGSDYDTPYSDARLFVMPVGGNPRTDVIDGVYFGHNDSIPTHTFSSGLGGTQYYVCISYPCVQGGTASDYTYHGVQLSISSVKSGITGTEDSYNITVGLTQTGEKQLADDTYIVNADSSRTLTYYATGNHVDNWTLTYNSNTKTGTGYVYTSLTDTSSKHPFYNTYLYSMSASNTYTSKSIVKYYHFSGKPDATVPNGTIYNYTKESGIDTGTVHTTTLGGTYYSELKNTSSWSYSYNATQTSISISSVTNDTYTVSTGDVNTKFTYTLNGSAGISSIKYKIVDNEYGESNEVTKQIIVCVHPKCIVTASEQYPEMGEEVTFTNESEEFTGTTCRYNWYRDGTLVASGKDSSYQYKYTPTDTNDHIIKIEGYDSINPSYASKPTGTVTIKAKTPIPVPVVSYDPSTVYYSDNVTFTLTEPYTPTVTITYQWYDNEVPIPGATSKSYTLVNIREQHKVYAVSSWSSYSEDSNTVTVNPTDPPVTVSTSVSPTRAYQNFTELEVNQRVIKDTLNITVDYYSYQLKYNTTTVDSYRFDTSDESYTYNTSTSPYIGTHTLTTTFGYTYTGTSGSTYSSSVSRSDSIYYSTPVPDPTFTLLTPSPVGEGQQIECKNTTNESGLPNISYYWTVNSSTYYTQDRLSITAATGVSVYTISLTATNGTYSNTSAGKSISVVEYYDPTERWTIVITDESNKIAIFSRDKLCPNNFAMLKFEHRLNEVGLGSVTLMCRENSDAVKSGNTIIIYDNVYAVYQGIITSAEQRNNFGLGSGNVEVKLFDLSFAEYTRKLTYKSPQTTGVATGSITTILNKLEPNLLTYTRSRGSYQGAYTYTIDNTNVLNQLDLLCNQFNIRYRMEMRRVVNFATYSNNSVYLANALADTKYFFYRTNGSIVFAILGTPTSRTYPITTRKVYGDNLPEIMNKACYSPNPAICLSSSFYDSEITSPIYGGSLKINDTCYDTNNTYTTEKEYGVLSISSPNTSNINQCCTVNLRKVVESDGSSSMFDNYVIESHDGIIVHAVNANNTGWFDVYVIGDFVDGSIFYYYMKYGGNYTYVAIPFEPGAASRAQKTYINLNGVSTEVTYIQSAVAYANVGLSQGMEESIVGSLIRGPYYVVSSSLSSSASIDIGAEHPSNYRIEDTKITITSYPNQPEVPMCHFVGVPVFTHSTESNSPYRLYPDTIMSVNVQNGLYYPQVELLAFNLIRYNSNFTSTVSGSCALKHWTDDEYRFPYVGGEVDITSYEPGADTLELECQSYTINADEMRCDFNLGMKPITIGDVIYRIKSNQMTNIN